ncbi:uncharacterized protein [Blastocystis hominis]|uniref:Uncharacterized protein n=1 Tax=Blastocystis hominis TaxID=12968 RepID=D8M0N3_BLAHO|nr:uncharacterized protein [Blastocystis hominis]CBK21622.2 unnamed protein product [Blastocystis hominis]|eukprot:XP_012895670.1 uncharacterized protein [Blastocystis hominis]
MKCTESNTIEDFLTKIILLLPLCILNTEIMSSSSEDANQTTSTTFQRKQRIGSDYVDQPEFWKSIQSLSLQEKSLYSDVDYTKRGVKKGRVRGYFVTRLLRNVAYYSFLFTILFYIFRTIQISYKNRLWDVFTACLVQSFSSRPCFQCPLSPRTSSP